MQGKDNIMEILLIDTASVIVEKNGFTVSALLKQGSRPVRLSYAGKIVSIDARDSNFCFVTFYTDKQRHVLTVKEYEIWLDGEQLI